MRRRATVIAAMLALAALASVAAASAMVDRAAPPTTAGSANSSLISCGKTRTIGFAAPITGAAASLGQQMLGWGRFFVTRYNRSHKKKLQLVPGDTQLPDTAQAIQVADRIRRSSQWWVPPVARRSRSRRRR
jgi:ABC-type branched-subunit amino acid transport system substrate-binding protein